MEKAADVTDADKKPEDDAKPALMRACIRVGRMFSRKTAELATEKTSLLTAAKTAGEAGATAMLGKGGFQFSAAADPNAETPEKFITAQLSSGCPNEATAIARMSKDKPELYATFRGLKK